MSRHNSLFYPFVNLIRLWRFGLFKPSSVPETTGRRSSPPKFWQLPRSQARMADHFEKKYDRGDAARPPKEARGGGDFFSK
ncbi:MAG TPA: hypothetical protein VM802_01090 [Chitinophaga sp.]|uniref:hypothetical protein n=1 Tax=Chitinophaga sp. TaxID=1869181 RepID=UPI002C768DAF|nr:hypothetical protein [Chitinophaga sp.]HVI43427.1 hypothetical protein [Chitinophaga sp.]